MKDYYYLLGIDKTASKDEIIKAYKKLSLKLHPDVNNGDAYFEEKFKEINEAYEVLSNDYKRGQYDERFHAQKEFVDSDQQNTHNEFKANTYYSSKVAENTSSNTYTSSAKPYSFSQADYKSLRYKAIKNLLIYAGIAIISHFLFIKINSLNPANANKYKDTGSNIISFLWLPMIFCGWRAVSYIVHQIMKNKIVFASIILRGFYYLIKLIISIPVGFICLQFYILFNILIIITPNIALKFRVLQNIF